MRKPVPYTYIVACKRRRRRLSWAVGVILGSGVLETLTNYTSRGAAISAAKMLAAGVGKVEVWA